MQWEATIDKSALINLVIERAFVVKPEAQAAMAFRLATVVDHNFGDEGEDRPLMWPDLEPGYARDFHDGDRTPRLILDGNLRASIQVDEFSFGAARVFTMNPYAAEHQFGTPQLPARPFFPVLNHELTEYSKAECIEAATDAARRALK